MIISTLVSYPILYLTIVVFKNYDLTYKIYRIWAWSICVWNGILPVFKGKKNLPKNSAFVMVANHTSELDIIVPYTQINKHFSFLAKKELTKAPLFNINFKGMNVTVDRKSMVSGKNSLKECNKKLQENISMLIFPEGTRSKTAPKLREFKSGPFKIAIEEQAPIVPVVFHNNYKRLAGGNLWFGKCGPGISKVEILEPISTKNLTSNDLKDLVTSTQKTIEAALKKGF